MTGDDRAPVIVGLGELTRRPGEDAELTDPGAMMAEAVRGAAEDSGAGEALLRKLQVVAAAPSAGWADSDPARRVTGLLGLTASTARSSMQGGNGPQLLVNVLAARIARGELDAAAVCSAEALASVVWAGKHGTDLGWPVPDAERVAGEVVEGEGTPPNTAAETAIGVIAPIMAYPLIENAITAAAERTFGEQLAIISQLWARFSEVAATQPGAWTPEVHSAERLASADDGNRRVTLPYLKLHNSNIQVDQAAAVVLTSAGTARALGIAEDRWVFVHAGAQAADRWFLSHRPELHRSPAIAACGRAAFGHAGVGPDDLAHVDLYSCFPAAVQLGAAELGLSLDRELTCTGGLTFFGGPGNGYATHGIAAVARRLRDGEPGERGLATALGWYATKHAVGVYGNRPPEQRFEAFTPDPQLPPAVEIADPGEHEATVETCTLIFERDGSPSYGPLFARLDDGRRVLGKADDPEVLAAMAADGFLGSRVQLSADRSFVPA